MTITLKIGGATTGRKFTDPVRYFKANDPYYWEVDNIPLKQLQENCKYLNDRLNTAIVSGNLDVSRQDLAELKPYVTGSDDKVRVNPGRYTARINNAHGLDHLDSFVRQNTSDTAGNYTNYAWTDSASLDVLITRIQSAVGEDSLNLNGLSERAFAQLTKSPDKVVDDLDEHPDRAALKWPIPSTLAIEGYNGKRYSASILPISEALDWYKYTWNWESGVTGSELFKTTLKANLDPNRLMHLPILENALIKYWRGTARTAIVDVPSGLEIIIPNFDEDDFPVSGATSRIDLVFIYSKPVDTSAVTIGKYDSTTTRTNRTRITEPILGVLKGAGGIVSDLRYGAKHHFHKGPIDEDGNSRIMASIADQNNTDNGFKVGVNQKVAIHGSFPSPEDLLNIAPLLSEQLSEDSWFLTGQTIFPVAYVKVNKSPGVNVAGSQVLVTDDIIDIRPLFRTAELTYNERAGIAAAMPPLSMANRAVGRYELEHEINLLHEDHDSRLDTIEASQIKFTTEHTKWISGSRGWRNIFTTQSNPNHIGSIIGTKAGPEVHDISKWIHGNTTHTSGRYVRSVNLTIEAIHIDGGRDIRSDVDTFNIYCNAERMDTGDVGNKAIPPSKISIWEDQKIMRYGCSIKGTNADKQHGGIHTFNQPVQYNWDTKKLEIYTWQDIAVAHGDYADYFILTINGYTYDKVNTVALHP